MALFSALTSAVLTTLVTLSEAIHNGDVYLLTGATFVCLLLAVATFARGQKVAFVVLAVLAFAGSAINDGSFDPKLIGLYALWVLTFYLVIATPKQALRFDFTSKLSFLVGGLLTVFPGALLFVDQPSASTGFTSYTSVSFDFNSSIGWMLTAGIVFSIAMLFHNPNMSLAFAVVTGIPILYSNHQVYVGDGLGAMVLPIINFFQLTINSVLLQVALGAAALLLLRRTKLSV